MGSHRRVCFVPRETWYFFAPDGTRYNCEIWGYPNIGDYYWRIENWNVSPHKIVGPTFLTLNEAWAWFKENVN